MNRITVQYLGFGETRDYEKQIGSKRPYDSSTAFANTSRLK